MEEKKRETARPFRVIVPLEVTFVAPNFFVVRRKVAVYAARCETHVRNAGVLNLPRQDVNDSNTDASVRTHTA